MFHVGDEVIGRMNSPYNITGYGWKGRVIAVTHNELYITVRGMDGTNYEVESKYFAPLNMEEVKEENKVNVSEIITNEERASLLERMETLLDKYDYEYTEDALNKIIDTWATNKADLITAFKKHPNYLQGKFMIVFSHDFARSTDTKNISEFSRWLTNVNTALAVREFMPEDMKNDCDKFGRRYPNNIYYLFINLTDYSAQYIDEETANKFNEIYGGIYARAGQKMSRVMNKLMAYIGLNKLPEYNQRFAKYADAINPLQITRHTILSVNPLDYLTMSFGNSWASCHTIDKKNKRKMPNSYEGMYSSGTVSYMLDKPSMVFYTVDASYNGNEFWNEPKINRQMFHWGEEKLVQGRLYPQDNDDNGGAYTPYREIVQKIMSEIFEFPNLWVVSKGMDAASNYVLSDGTHYRDYECYSNCTQSKPKGSENKTFITIGHVPICIDCGYEHDVQNNISCCAGRYTCQNCSCTIDDEDNVRWVNGEPYCSDCVNWCEYCEEYFVGEGTEVNGGAYVCDDCLSEYYHRCPDCDEFYRNDRMRYVPSVDDEVCPFCFEDDYVPCEDCGEYFRSEDLEEHHGHWLCNYCLEQAKENEEAEENSEEAV